MNKMGFGAQWAYLVGGYGISHVASQEMMLLRSVKNILTAPGSILCCTVWMLDLKMDNASLLNYISSAICYCVLGNLRHTFK